MKLFLVLVCLGALGVSVMPAAACPLPPTGHEHEIYRLADLGITNPTTVAINETADDGSLRTINAPVGDDFVLERHASSDGFERWLILYHCDGTTWRSVSGSVLKLNSRDADRLATLPKTYKVKAGESLASVARKVGSTPTALREWNSLPNRPLYRGEEVFVTAPAVTGLRRWNFVLGDPAGIDLRKQIELMPEPAHVRQEWISLVEATQPDTVTLSSTAEHPLLLDCLVFGGLKSDSVKVWGPTACYWKSATDPNGTITSLPALRYPSVFFEGNRYDLVQFLDCHNGGCLKTPVNVQAETERAPLPVAVATLPVEPAPAPEPEVVPTVTPRDWVQNGVIWVVGERSDLIDAKQHSTNGFSGIEWIYRPKVDGPLAIVGRISPNVMHSFGSHDARLGLRTTVLDKSGCRLDLEGGGWLNSAEHSYTVRQQITPEHLHWEERGQTFTSYGPYLRLLAFAPALTYLDVLARTGHGLGYNLGGSITTEPGWFYAKLGYDRTKWNARSHAIPSTTTLGSVEAVDRLDLPADMMSMAEIRLGVKPWPNFIVYGSYHQWTYASTVWDFTWWGPGAGIDWRLSSHWRVFPSIKRFSDVDHDRSNGRRYDDKQWRSQLGVTYEW